MRTPKLRKHSTRDVGFVQLNGKRHYLGRWGDPATEERYHRLLAEWAANGRRAPLEPGDVLTVSELVLRFMEHATVYYRDDEGKPTSSIAEFRAALRVLVKLYGRVPVDEISPQTMKTIQHELVGADLSRRTINRYASRIRQVFRWGASEGVVPLGVCEALRTVRGLLRGRTPARDQQPVGPVPREHIDAIRSHVSRQVWALVNLQLLTGARPGELLGVRPVDLQMGGDVWTLRLRCHKTSHHGRDRTIRFGPKAQPLIEEFMQDRAMDAYLFSPREAHAQRRSAGAASRRRLGQGLSPRSSRRTIGERYTTASYRRAVTRACKDANVPPWSPNQLRHNAATDLRKEFGVEGAQVVLGHAHLRTTEVYAERDALRAEAIIRKVG